MPDPKDWSVEFNESIEVQLDPAKLKDGKVESTVQREIQEAIQNAVISTLRKRELLAKPEKISFRARPKEGEVQPIKSLAAPVKMAAPGYWSVKFNERLNLPLDSSQLQGDTVSPEVLGKLHEALRNAVLSTLQSHQLLTKAEPESIDAQPEAAGEIPIKFARAPIKQDGPSEG